MDIIEILSAAAAIAAVVGVPIMIAQAFDGRKGRKLQEAQASSQNPNFEISDVLDSYLVQGSAGSSILNFFVLITNRSDKPLSLNKIRLHLVGEIREVTISPILDTNGIHDGYNVAPNNSSTEWIRFSVDNILHRDLRIVKYVLRLTDAYGNSADRTVVYLREVINDDEKVD